MMAHASYILIGVLLPILAGSAVARVLFPSVSRFRAVESLGMGMLLGPALVSAIMNLQSGDVAFAARSAAVVATALIVVLWFVPGPRTAEPLPPWLKKSRLLATVACVFLALLIIHFILLAHEVLLRPTFPWDAWSSWAYKAKAWYLLGYKPEFVTRVSWLQGHETEAYAVVAPHYPTLVAGFQVYLAHWLGSWREPLLNVPWLMASAAILLLIMGEGRRLTGLLLPGIFAAFAVLTLPLFATHIALAGYMELWVAAFLLALVITIARASEEDNWRSWLLSTVLALALISTKVEALIWVAVIAVLWLLLLVLRKTTRAAHKHVLLVPALTGMTFPAAALSAWFGINLHVPYVGSLAFHLNPDASRFLASLAASWNWHLLFPILLVCVALDLIHRANQLPLNWYRSAATAGLSIVFILCVFLRVNGSAPDVTNYNRIVLQWVPVWTLYGLAVVDAIQRRIGPRDSIFSERKPDEIPQHVPTRQDEISDVDAAIPKGP